MGFVPMVRKFYRWLRHLIMARSGLEPEDAYVLSRSGRPVRDDRALAIPLPNLTGSLLPVLRQFINGYGWGKTCLLVSESRQVQSELALLYPDVSFKVTDYFPDLMQGGADILWDVCETPPPSLRKGSFDSILCQALLEHVIAPAQAIQHCLELLVPGGHLYIMTHTPSFHYHGYPKDYVRFHTDYFEDLPGYMARSAGLTVELVELYAKGGAVYACYERVDHPSPALNPPYN